MYKISALLHVQAGRPYIQTPFLLCKMLVGIVPNPLCAASAGCRLSICTKCFYNEKDHRGLSQNGSNPRWSLFIGSALFPWWPFLLRKTSLHSSVLSSVPASHPAPCGRLDKRLFFCESSAEYSVFSSFTFGSFLSPASSKAAFARPGAA